MSEYRQDKDWLWFWNIWPDAINCAVNQADYAMTKYGCDVSEMDYAATCAFEDWVESGDRSDITNSIIKTYFDAAKSAILEKVPTLRIDYEVNGPCSDFIIDGESV